MDGIARLAAASRDGHLALRRVERQHAIIERLHAAHGRRVRLGELAGDFSVSVRTVARDVERLRLSGVPLSTHRGHNGGVSMDAPEKAEPISFDTAEIAAIMASLTAVGPTVSASATSAMRKLRVALTQPPPAAWPGRVTRLP